jgi:hypothetical protein
LHAKQNWSDAADGAAAAAANPLLLLSLDAADRVLFSSAKHHVSQPREAEASFAPALTWPSLLTLSLGLLFRGGIGYAVAHFYRTGHRWLWALLALVTGPAGVLTLMALRRLPSRIKCPACGAPRGVADLACPRCHEQWPSPTRTGAEVFSG